jgi:phosphatidate cytidylyltransferase
MAYLVGSFVGKTPLSKISPKKTVEGTIGGILLCIAVAGMAAYLVFHEWVFMFFCMSIAGICSIFGTMGDLLESKIKRLAGVKDSGHFMPGHGGFLDRFDSLLVAIPFVWLFLKLTTC